MAQTLLALMIFVVAIAGLLVGGWLRPDLFLVRLPLWVITRTLYRFRTVDLENVPQSGPALFVCNAVSYLDWLFVMAASPRYIHLVTFNSWACHPILRHFLRWAGVIILDAPTTPAIDASLRAASESLSKGGTVCILAEWVRASDGLVLPFSRSARQIVAGCSVPVPIVPVILDTFWGSIFSIRAGKLIWKWPQLLDISGQVVFGEPLPPGTDAAEISLALQKLSADCSLNRENDRELVHRHFVRIAARHPFRSCLVDTTAGSGVFNYGKVLAGAMLLGRKLRPMLQTEAMVGIWLPPSAGGVFANISLALLGKTVVNLNYTSSSDTIQSAIRQCGIKHVLTSRRFTGQKSLDPGLASS